MKDEWSFVVDIAQSWGVPEQHCEDVAIEVFLRLERHYGFMSSSEPPVIRAWLRTTTVHIAQEQQLSLRATSDSLSRGAPGSGAASLSRGVSTSLSRATSTGPSREADPDLVEATNLVATPEEQLMALQTQGSLRSLVGTLEPGRRDVFVGHILEEDPMHEVAKRLGIPEATAYNRLRLAREDLRVAILRTWKTEERKPGGRSFAIVPLLLTGVALTPGHPTAESASPVDRSGQSAPRPEWQSDAPEGGQLAPAPEPPFARREEWQSAPVGPRRPDPRDAPAPLPRGVLQLPPSDVRQSVPRAGRWRPRLLLALAASALRRGDLQEAAFALHLYHVEYPDDPLADDHREVQSRLEARTR